MNDSLAMQTKITLDHSVRELGILADVQIVNTYPYVGETDYNLVMHIWAVHHKEPVYSIFALSRKILISETSDHISRPDVKLALGLATEKVGFVLSFSKIAIASGSDVEIWCKYSFQDSCKFIRLAEVSGLSTPAFCSPSRFRQISIVGLGRSGTTYLCSLLKKHPSICGIGGYPYEFRMASYFLHLAKILSSPALHAASMHPDSFETLMPTTIGHNPYNHPIYFAGIKKPALSLFINNSVALSAISMCRSAIEDLYDVASRDLSKLDSIFYFEKMQLSPLIFCAENMMNAKTIVLVRDIRDVYISARNFNAIRRSHSFGRESCTSDNEWIASLAKTFNDLHQFCTSYSDSIHILRFEDLMEHRDEAIAKILWFIGAKVIHLELSDEERLALKSTHSTFINSKANLPRWFSEDKTPEIQLLKNECYEALNYFNYKAKCPS